MHERDSLARVWINVTTSANWKRPAVGIVRVEQAMATHLQAMLGDRCRLCVWQDDRFVEWSAPATDITSDEEMAIDALVPRGPSFDLVRPFLTRALRRYGKAESTTERSGAPEGVSVTIRSGKSSPLHPGPGDFLLSIGLDWDMQYTSRFHAMATRQGLRIITCCYDLIPVLFPHYCVGEVAKRFTEYFLDLSWGSEAVLCISEQTRRDYEELCARVGAPRRRTQIIPLGDNIPHGDAAISDPVLAATKSPFILFVSTIERRKNHEVLYRAYHLLIRERRLPVLPKLVFVGMHGWGINDLMKDIELDPLTKGTIVELNHVSDSELRHLYEKALFCVYPSLYEGWGLPVGEALAMGKAVIASGEGSLPEVGGDLVRYVPAWNPYAWADAIAEYVGNPGLVAAEEFRVQSTYKPREWSAMAACVSTLIDELSTKSAGPVVMRPGYDMSTIDGLHEGPSITAEGSAGLLLFGPHRAIAAGRYDICVAGSLENASRATASYSVVSRGGTHVHTGLKQPLTDVEPGPFTVRLMANFATDISDLEIKCETDGPSDLRLDLVTIARAV